MGKEHCQPIFSLLQGNGIIGCPAGAKEFFHCTNRLYRWRKNIIRNNGSAIFGIALLNSIVIAKKNLFNGNNRLTRGGK